MKASVKIRDGKPPLLRAKLPLNLLGLPALSKVSMGSAQELGLHFGTLFEAGPACRLTYRPNDPRSAISFTLKTGFGPWGSPDDAALVMAAEFNLASHGKPPSFLLRIKPRAGDFCLHKEVRSLPPLAPEDGTKAPHFTVHDQKLAVSPVAFKDDGGGAVFSVREKVVSGAAFKDDGGAVLSVKERVLAGDVDSTEGRARVKVLDRANSFDPESVTALESNGGFKVEGAPKIKHAAKGGTNFSKEQASDKGSDDSCVIGGAAEESAQSEHIEHEQNFNSYSKKQKLSSSLKGWSLIAHSSLPIGKGAVATFRWRLGIPGNLDESLAKFPKGFSFLGLPLLVMDKVSFETIQHSTRRGWSPNVFHLRGSSRQREELEELGRVAAICGLMRRQMHLIHAENEVLKKTMEDMRAEMDYRGTFSSHLDVDAVHELSTQENDLRRAPKYAEALGKSKGPSSSATNGRKVAQSLESRPRTDSSKRDHSLPETKREATTLSSKPSAEEKTTSGLSQVSGSKLSEELRKALENQTSSTSEK